MENMFKLSEWLTIPYIVYYVLFVIYNMPYKCVNKI